jgi:uncharacterized protein (UPF0332 family)
MSAAPGFDWSEYLTLARQLAAGANEAALRSAISRAYYCIYHKALDRAISSGYVDARSHQTLWALYGGNPDRLCRKLSDLGSRMKKERVSADYEPIVPRLHERVDVQLWRASEFLRQLSTLKPGLPWP